MDDAIFGGATYTDLPCGIAYYPSDNAASHDLHVSNGPGVLLASYTLGAHAQRYAAYSPGNAAAYAITALGKVHPQLRQREMVGKSLSWSWGSLPFAGGGFAAPGKREELRRHLSAPEGRLFFAGEHASQNRSWIQGALESSLAAVKDMLAVYARR